MMCADIHYQEQSDYVRRLFQLFGNQGNYHLDLACGTGPHIEYFIGYGFTCSGLDIHQPMLNIAQQRCPQASFILGDMSQFEVDEPQSLITCFLYSIHYNNNLDKLAACIANVHRALSAGGLFCFNAVDKSKIDNHSFVQHTATYNESIFGFKSGWYYPGQGDEQLLKLNIQKTTDGITQSWQDQHAMVAISFDALRRLLEPYFEVQIFEHTYDRINLWEGESGNAIFACIKK